MPLNVDIECVCRKSEHLDDWYVVERAEHDGHEWYEETEPGGFSLHLSSRISNADVEGSGSEMLAIADAIDAESDLRFYRCAVRVQHGRALLWSPRNSSQGKAGVISLACAKRLAQSIRDTVVARKTP